MDKYRCDKCKNCKYNYADSPPIVDYDSIDDFIEDILIELLENECDDNIGTTSIVVNGELVQEILRKLFTLKVNGEYFNMSSIEFDSNDYDEEYIIDIASDMNMGCTPAFFCNDECAEYLTIEADHVYLYGAVSEELAENVESKDITIFGFEE